MQIGIDVGGTFTDLVAIDDSGNLTLAKCPSDRNALTRSIEQVMTRGFNGERAKISAVTQVFYSTTVATNALLNHEFARMGLIVTRGFREILETTPKPADHCGSTRLPPIVALEDVREIQGRLDPHGEEREALNVAEIEAIAREYQSIGIELVAVSLLHSYASPVQERNVRNIFSSVAPNIRVVLSCDVLPEFREFERTLTTCLSASLNHTMAAHFAQVNQVLSGEDLPLLIMKSTGGLSIPSEIIKQPISTIMSGPSAAALGAAWLLKQLDIKQAIALDVGGTSTDVALINNGVIGTTTRGEIAGYPNKIPALEVTSIGAGGGSHAIRTPDKRWRVGPSSAGAIPGPVCYGKGGTQVTVCDAQLVLGRLPEALLGNGLVLDKRAACEALTDFGHERNLDAVETARGIVQLANEAMCGAIRRVTAARGVDPRKQVLVASGGAGPLHAAEVARLLGIKKIVVPRHPGFTAAFGLHVADMREDFTRSFPCHSDDLPVDRITEIYRELEASAKNTFACRTESGKNIKLSRSIDMRYQGMSQEFSVQLGGEQLNVEALRQAIDEFHDQYHALTGHSYRGEYRVEIITFRLSATLRLKKPLATLSAKSALSEDSPARRAVYFSDDSKAVDCAILRRDRLAPGTCLTGPLVIEEYEATTLVPPDFDLQVDEYGQMHLIFRADVAN